MAWLTRWRMLCSSTVKGIEGGGRAEQHGIILAAHGLYSCWRGRCAAHTRLGLPVPLVLETISPFHGLVRALAHAL